MSDLDMMLMSVGEELKSSKIKIKNKIISNNDSKNNSSSGGGSESGTTGLLEIPGGLWTTGVGRRKRCRHSKGTKKGYGSYAETECNRGCDEECGVKLEDSAGGEDGQQKNEKIEVDRNLEMEVLKKMKNGNLDPSKNLPIDAYEIAKNISLSNANSSSPHTDTSNMKKLMRMLQLILLADDMRLNSNGDKQKWFDSVKLNLDGTKLIFRSKDILNAEAFCFIVWGHKNKDNIDGKNDEIDGINDRLDHSAVVQCENEDFRRIVIEALQLIQ